ncbi:nuclear transport factor 2 family protein [Candidatus Woesearchaeota archaeon]|nr:MAG: nuclear transport factor 2 family protein [Candidatus Woesearchaeota archaeon]
MVSKQRVKELLKTYKEAWVNQDINKILSIFAEDGVYHERAFKKPFKGHKEIADYWKTKVCEEQSKIEFKLLNFFVCGNTVIAEWEAFFNSNIENARIHIKEVAILEIKNELIKSLREYWHSEKLPLK